MEYQQRTYDMTPAGQRVSAAPPLSSMFGTRTQQPTRSRRALALSADDDVDDTVDEGLDHADDYDGQGGDDDSDAGQDGDTGDDDDRGRQLIDKIADPGIDCYDDIGEGNSGVRDSLVVDPDDTQVGEDDDDAIGIDALGRPLPWQQPTAKANVTPVSNAVVDD